MTEKEPDWQQLMDGLTAALEALKRCDPYLDGDDFERSSLARHFIRRVLLAICQLGDGYKPDDHFADVSKMVMARRRDHIRRLRVMETSRDA